MRASRACIRTEVRDSMGRSLMHKTLTSVIALAGLAAAGAAQAEPITLTEEQSDAVVAGDFAVGVGAGYAAAYVGPAGEAALGVGYGFGYARDDDGQPAAAVGVGVGAAATATGAAAAYGYGYGAGATTP
jgi:hypothetical protein